MEQGQPLTLEHIRLRVPGYEGDEKASERRLLRDIRELGEMGLPVERHDFDHYYLMEGYSIPAQGYYLAPLELSASEKLAVFFVRELLAGQRGFPFVQELGELGRKLMFYSAPGEVSAATMPDTRLTPPKGKGSSWDMAWQALCDRRRLSIRYFRRRKKRTRERKFDPYGLGLYEGRWYLVGFCHLRREIITLRFSEIRRLSPASAGAGPDFEIPQGFDLRRHVGGQYWYSAEGAPVEVEFGPGLAPSMEVNYAHLGNYRAARGGGRVLATRVRDEGGFIDWLLPFQDKAVIRKPASLRRKMRARLEEMLRAV